MIEILCHSERDALVLEIVGELHGAGPVLHSCLEAAKDTDVATIILDLSAAGALDDATVATLQEAAASFATTGRSLWVRGEPGSNTPVAVRAAKVDSL